jgi:hypothetical protein
MSWEDFGWYDDAMQGGFEPDFGIGSNEDWSQAFDIDPDYLNALPGNLGLDSIQPEWLMDPGIVGPSEETPWAENWNYDPRLINEPFFSEQLPVNPISSDLVMEPPTQFGIQGPYQNAMLPPGESGVRNGVGNGGGNGGGNGNGQPGFWSKMGTGMVDSVTRNPLGGLAALAGAGIAGAGLAQRTPRMSPPNRVLSPQEQQLIQQAQESAQASPNDEVTEAMKARILAALRGEGGVDPRLERQIEEEKRSFTDRAIRQGGSGATTSDWYNRAMAEIEQRAKESRHTVADSILRGDVAGRNQSLQTNAALSGQKSANLSNIFQNLAGVGNMNTQMEYGSRQFNAAAKADEKKTNTLGGSQLLGYGLGSLRDRRY